MIESAASTDTSPKYKRQVGEDKKTAVVNQSDTRAKDHNVQEIHSKEVRMIGTNNGDQSQQGQEELNQPAAIVNDAIEEPKSRAGESMLQDKSRLMDTRVSVSSSTTSTSTPKNRSSSSAIQTTDCGWNSSSATSSLGPEAIALVSERFEGVTEALRDIVVRSKETFLKRQERYTKERRKMMIQLAELTEIVNSTRKVTDDTITERDVLSRELEDRKADQNRKELDFQREREEWKKEADARAERNREITEALRMEISSVMKSLKKENEEKEIANGQLRTERERKTQLLQEISALKGRHTAEKLVLEKQISVLMKKLVSSEDGSTKLRILSEKFATLEDSFRVQSEKLIQMTNELKVAKCEALEQRRRCEEASKERDKVMEQNAVLQAQIRFLLQPPKD